MILEGLLNLLLSLVELIFNVLPTIPSLDESMMLSLQSFFDSLSSSLGLFYFFIRPSTVRSCLALALVIVEFEHIYNFFIWIIKKIPFINIE